MKKLMLTVCLILGLLIASTADADTVLLDYQNVYGEIVYISGTWHTGSVWAGIYKLIVDGRSVDSFCIDLQDNTTTTPKEYDVVALWQAPDPTLGPMGTEKAIVIEKLWNMAYHPDMTTAEAAALQVAIWDVLVDLDYSVSTGGFRSTYTAANTLLNDVQSWTGRSHLEAYTDPTYQDYVVTPEPGILILLGIALSAVGLAARRYKF